MNDSTAEHVANVLKAIAHPVRLKIIAELATGEKCVSEIGEAVGGKQSITSQQLNMMKDKGVLSCRKDGSKVFYKIEDSNVLNVLSCINKHCDR